MIRSSSSSFARFSARPLTATPFVESRSTIQKVEPSWRISACRREMFGSATRMSASFDRPMTMTGFSSLCCEPSTVTVAGSALHAELLGGDCFRLGRRGPVDARRAGLDFGLGRLLGELALDHPVGDAEEAYLEVLVRPEGHLRARQELVALSPSVLGQVLLELLDERGLVALELVAVLRRQVDDVLVRGVDLRDGDHLVVVHLLRQLPRELDRLHVATEGAPEGAFEERFDLLLDRPEHGGDLLGGGRV